MLLPAVSRRLRRLRRHFGIAAPTVVIRNHWSPLRVSMIALGLFAACSVSFWGGLRVYGPPRLEDELLGLRGQLESYRQELHQLRAEAGGGQSALAIERSAQQQLLLKVERLERDNAVLREDLRFFERLVATSDAAIPLRIEGFRVAQDVGSAYRYRLFVVFSADRKASEFRGKLQLLVTYSLGGEEKQLQLPVEGGQAAEYMITVRHFLRREGRFELPAGAQLKWVDARIFQGDVLKNRKRAQL